MVYMERVVVSSFHCGFIVPLPRSAGLACDICTKGLRVWFMVCLMRGVVRVVVMHALQGCTYTLQGWSGVFLTDFPYTVWTWVFVYILMIVHYVEVQDVFRVVA